MTQPLTISRHFLRRRARLQAEKLTASLPVDSKVRYRVVPAHRGPFRWRVVKVLIPE
jgi:hypothetical protein